MTQLRRLSCRAARVSFPLYAPSHSPEQRRPAILKGKLQLRLSRDLGLGTRHSQADQGTSEAARHGARPSGFDAISGHGSELDVKPKSRESSLDSREMLWLMTGHTTAQWLAMRNRPRLSAGEDSGETTRSHSAGKGIQLCAGPRWRERPVIRGNGRIETSLLDGKFAPSVTQ